MDALQKPATPEILVKRAKPKLKAYLIQHPGFHATRKLLDRFKPQDKPVILQALHELYIARQIEYTLGRGFFYDSRRLK